MTEACNKKPIESLIDDPQNPERTLPVIEWHGEVLARRERFLEGGLDSFLTLEEAEKRIREKTGRG